MIEWRDPLFWMTDARTVQDGRKASRSQEIDVNSFHEEPVSSEGTGRPVIETSVIQARSSEDSKDAKYLVLRLRGETEHDINDNMTIKGIASAW